MGSTLSNVFGNRGSIQQEQQYPVTYEAQDEAIELLRARVLGQDEAVSILISWLTSAYGKGRGSMYGSLCFVGPPGVGQSRCTKILGKAFGARVANVDMAQFSSIDECYLLLNALESVQGSNIITFTNVERAHKSALSVLDQVIRTRAVSISNFKKLGISDISNFASSSAAPKVISFPKVIFIVIYHPYHTLRSHASHVLVRQARQRFSDLHSVGFAKLFDSYVPFKTLSEDVARLIVRSELARFGNIASEDEVLAGVYDLDEGFVVSVHRWLQLHASAQLFESPEPKLPSRYAGRYPLLAKHKRELETPSTNKKPRLEKQANVTLEQSNNTTTTISTDSNNPTTDSNNPTTISTDSNNPTTISTDSNNPTTDSNNPTTTADTNKENIGNENEINQQSKNTNTTSGIPVNFSNIDLSNAESEMVATADPEKVQPFPIRENITVRAFVDGAPYFSQIYTEFSNAKSEILICGWMFGSIYLKRPASMETSLTHVLGNAALRGVSIFIMLRENDRFVCPNGHNLSKATLEQLHPNIKVSLQSRGGYLPSVWSHHQKFVVVDRSVGYVGGLDLSYNRWDTPAHDVVETAANMFPAQDYYNSFYPGITDRGVHPRMGWHDVQISVDGEIVRDLHDSFLQRWNYVEPSIRLHRMLGPPIPSNGTCNAQLVRSIDGNAIGGGKGVKEKGILDSYVELINGARTFIYIENQYFIYREISTALSNRILKAHRTKQQFHVAVVLPLLPDNGTINSEVMKEIMEQQNATIQSIFTSLQVRSIVAQKYINFYGLRNFGKIGDKLVTAQIYVHSKVMIADDLAVVGSANINSRSLTGDGDTEIAVVVHNGEFCVNLVQQLLSEHTGKLFLDNRIHQFMMGTLYHVAARNTAAYEKVFGYSVASYAKDAKSYLATVRDLVADDDDNELQSLSGHIVMFPRDFLAGYVAPSKLNRLNPVRKIRRNITG